MKKNFLLVLLALLLFSSGTIAAKSTVNQRFYVGTAVCRQCHHDQEKSENNRDPYHVWFHSKHALAYHALAKPESQEIARLSGIDTDPFNSPVCLGCHTTASDTEAWRRDQTFFLEDGIQCEYCHGPGSDYMDPEIMADRTKARTAGLLMPGKDICMMCHNSKGSHRAVLNVRPFEYETFLKEISHSGKAVIRRGPPIAAPARPLTKDAESSGHDSGTLETVYKTPFNLTVSKDGKRVFVACEASDSLIVIDTERAKIIKEIAVQNLPHGVLLTPDESQILVSNRGTDTVSVIDAAAYTVLKHISTGDEPHGMQTDVTGKTLYVANAGSNDISVIDLQAGREIKRLSAGRGAWDMCRAPDGRSIWVTSNLSQFVPFRTPSISEVTVVDTRRSIVTHRVMMQAANLLQGIDFAPDGQFALVTLIRTKNLLPITRVMQGWMITNGIGILWKDGRVDQLLLDETDRYFADPTDIVITPDGKYGYVTGGGIDAVAVIDIEKMKAIVNNADAKKRQEVLPNHLGIPAEYVLKRIPVGRGPRGLVASPDGRFVYVADALDDTISVIDVAKQNRSQVIDLGGPKQITLIRKGERIFHSAAITYGQQFSCHTCHPDGGVDCITYDIEPDGLGVNPVDNRTLRGILDTAPFKWTGKNPTLSRQCGPRLAVFFTRIDPFTPEQVVALERYICTIPRNPNRYRVGSELTPAQRRGKALFERTTTNSGQMIPKIQRCNVCHSGPYFTNRTMVDVGTASPIDTHATFDVPHLNNIYETAPYLHDGRADTLEEIWTRFNPYDKHGFTNDMTKDQLNDLIEYLKTL